MDNTNPNRQKQNKKLIWAFLLNLTISLIQIIGGLLSNSLALLSDAFHNLSDALSLLISYIASTIGYRKANEKKTFGYKRIEILAAFFNSLMLITLTIYLLYESYFRLLNPQPIKESLMLIIASFGLAANLTAVLLLNKDKKENLNIKSAYLHLLGDTFSSIAVIAASIAMHYSNAFWLDPIITVVIAAYLLYHSILLLKQAFNILMQSVPQGIVIEQIKADIESIREIDNAHNIRIWGLNEHVLFLECHIAVNSDIHLSETKNIFNKIETLCSQNHGIENVTLQFEYKYCLKPQLL